MIETRFQRWASLERNPGALPQATDERRALGAKQKPAACQPASVRLATLPVNEAALRRDRYLVEFGAAPGR
jgi:hypothetical protein